LVTPYDPTAVQSLSQLHALGLSDQAAAGLLTRGVIGQAYLLSSLDMFYVSGWLALALIPLCWLVPRPAGAAATAAAE
jgi:DHA2 family multidrug resistance protein